MPKVTKIKLKCTKKKWIQKLEMSCALSYQERGLKTGPFLTFRSVDPFLTLIQEKLDYLCRILDQEMWQPEYSLK